MYAPVEGDRELKLEIDRWEEPLALNSSLPVLEKQTHHYYIIINLKKIYKTKLWWLTGLYIEFNRQVNVSLHRSEQDIGIYY